MVFKLVNTYDAARYELRASGRASASGRAVADVLDSGAMGKTLRDQLLVSLANSGARRAELQESKAQQLDRLSRCRVFFDDRESVEAVRQDLHHRLRAFRNHHRQGLGDRSAGLMLEYLVDEILRRAADSRHAEFTLREPRDLLLVDGDALRSGPAPGTGAGQSDSSRRSPTSSAPISWLRSRKLWAPTRGLAFAGPRWSGCPALASPVWPQPMPLTMRTPTSGSSGWTPRHQRR